MNNLLPGKYTRRALMLFERSKKVKVGANAVIPLMFHAHTPWWIVVWWKYPALSSLPACSAVPDGKYKNSITLPPECTVWKWSVSPTQTHQAAPTFPFQWTEVYALLPWKSSDSQVLHHSEWLLAINVIIGRWQKCSLSPLRNTPGFIPRICIHYRGRISRAMGT